jgi:D-alanine-D-alanine ligase
LGVYATKSTEQNTKYCTDSYICGRYIPFWFTKLSYLPDTVQFQSRSAHMTTKRRGGLAVQAKASPSPIGTRAAHLELLLAELAQKLRVAVVYGGNKAAPGAVLRAAPNTRSWKSYESVARDIAAALERVGFGQVTVIPDDMHLAARLKDSRSGLVWLNTGGVQGRNAISHTPAMLEMFGIPYVGHDPLTAGLLDSKHHFKRQLQALGIPTAPFFVWAPTEAREPPFSDRRLRARFAKWDNGFVVKPVTGRASLHVHYVEKASGLNDAIRHVHDMTQNSVLVEAYLPGREYCIAVSGPTVARRGKLWQLPGPFAFSALERKLGRGERIFTSMDLKPITAARTRALSPVRDADVIEQLSSIARQVYVGTPLQTLVRLDLRADDRGRLYVLEANPKPDLAAPRATSASLISIGLPELGMTYDDLIQSVLAERVNTLFEGRPESVASFMQSFLYPKHGGRP